MYYTIVININNKKCDPQWAKIPIGTSDSQTICSVGCLMSSVSMAINGKNISIGNNVSNPGMSLSIIICIIIKRRVGLKWKHENEKWKMKRGWIKNKWNEWMKERKRGECNCHLQRCWITGSLIITDMLTATISRRSIFFFFFFFLFFAKNK